MINLVTLLSMLDIINNDKLKNNIDELQRLHQIVKLKALSLSIVPTSYMVLLYSIVSIL